MNRSFNKSQPLRNVESNAVEVKSKVSVEGWLFLLCGFGEKMGFFFLKSSHGRPVTEQELVGPTLCSSRHIFCSLAGTKIWSRSQNGTWTRQFVDVCVICSDYFPSYFRLNADCADLAVSLCVTKLRGGGLGF